jgi:MHS family proline/betaine transporter-like MFS transporter
MPTFEKIGIWAAVGVVVARLLQGAAAGGEYGSAIPFLVEMSGSKRRGLTGSWQQCGNAIGLLLGSLFALALTKYLSSGEMNEWGWRIPFVVGILPAFFGWYLRLRLPETPIFARMETQATKARSPFREVMSFHRGDLFRALGMIAHIAAGFYVILVFMPTYLGLVSKIDRSQALVVTTTGLIAYAVLCPIAGALSDRLGRKMLLLISSAGAIFLTYPLFFMVKSGDFDSALAAEVVLSALLACSGGPIAAAVAEVAPAKVRSTIVAMSFAFSITIFGGFAPFIATYLISTSGSPLAPAFYAMAASLVSFVVILAAKETAFVDSD